MKVSELYNTPVDTPEKLPPHSIRCLCGQLIACGLSVRDHMSDCPACQRAADTAGCKVGDLYFNQHKQLTAPIVIPENGPVPIPQYERQ